MRLLSNELATQSLFETLSIQQLQNMALCAKSFRLPVYRAIFRRKDEQSVIIQCRVLEYALASIQQMSDEDKQQWLGLLAVIKSNPSHYRVWRSAATLWLALQTASNTELTDEIAQFQLRRNDAPLELSTMMQQVFTARGETPQAKLLQSFHERLNDILKTLPNKMKHKLYHENCAGPDQLNELVVALLTENSNREQLGDKIIRILSSKNTPVDLIKRIILQIKDAQFNKRHIATLQGLFRLLNLNHCRELLPHFIKENATKEIDIKCQLALLTCFPRDAKFFDMTLHLIQTHAPDIYRDEVMLHFARGINHHENLIKFADVFLSKCMLTTYSEKTFSFIFSEMSTEEISVRLGKIDDALNDLEHCGVLMSCIKKPTIIANLSERMVAIVKRYNIPLLDDPNYNSPVAGFTSFGTWSDTFIQARENFTDELCESLIAIFLEKITNSNHQNYAHPMIIMFQQTRESILKVVAALILQIKNETRRCQYLDDYLACINGLTQLGLFHLPLVRDIALTLQDTRTIKKAIEFLKGDKNSTSAAQDPMALLTDMAQLDDLMGFAARFSVANHNFEREGYVKTVSLKIADNEQQITYLVEMLEITREKHIRTYINAIAFGLNNLNRNDFQKIVKEYVFPLTHSEHYLLGVDIIDLCQLQVINSGLISEVFQTLFNNVMDAIDNHTKNVCDKSIVLLYNLLLLRADPTLKRYLADMVTLVIQKHRQKPGTLLNSYDNPIFDRVIATLQCLQPSDRTSVLKELLENSHYHRPYMPAVITTLSPNVTAHDKLNAVVRIISCTMTDLAIALRGDAEDQSKLLFSARRALDDWAAGKKDSAMPNEFVSLFDALKDEQSLVQANNHAVNIDDDNDTISSTQGQIHHR